MLAQISLGLTLIIAAPVWSQVAPSATGGINTSSDSEQMIAPPPVSGQIYPTTVGSQARSNYLNLLFSFTPAYDDNAVVGSSIKPIGEASYFISPSIEFDRTTTRQHQSFTYSPGFDIYQRTSQLNAVDQNAAVDWDYRFNARTTLSVRDSFTKTSNVFSQSSVFSGSEISGSLQNSTAAVIAPFAEQISDRGNAALSYQFSKNAMLGAGGDFSVFDFPNPSQAAGLANSRTSGGSAFYVRRLSRTQDFGVVYQYDRVLAFPVDAQSESQIQAFLPFYTFSLNHTLSFSLSAGAQHLATSETDTQSFKSWSFADSASIGWQTTNFALAVNYSRSVEAGEGLVGAFQANSVSANGNWRLSHTWSAGMGMSYTSTTNVASQYSTSYLGGSAIAGQASIQHAFGERFNVQFGYQRLHEGYGGIAVIASDPDSDREYLTINYRLNRPLGR